MKLILAPMATLSHEAFRRAVVRFGGCDEYFTEMINASSLLNMGPWEKYYLLGGPEPEKIVWQLTGNKSTPMAQAAAFLAEREGIGIDLNMGCCAPQIANTGAGISWMTKPIAETAQMVRGVKSAIANAAKDGAPEKLLSVKLRLGADDFTDDGFFAFCDMLVGEGVQLLTLHARTKKEKYRRPPRYAYVEQLALRYADRIPVYLNGAVCDRATYDVAVQAAPHAGGVMIARAAAQKPWVFAEIVGAEKEMASGTPQETATGSAPETERPSAIDCEEVALQFISDVEECQPPEFYKTRLQRFFAYYCDNFSFAHWFKTQMLNAATPEQSRERVREYFAKCSEDRFRSF